MAPKITLLYIPFVLNFNWIYHLQKQISSDQIKVSLMLDIEPATSSILDMTDPWRVAVLYVVIIIVRRIKVILLLETAFLNSLSKLTVDFSFIFFVCNIWRHFQYVKRYNWFLVHLKGSKYIQVGMCQHGNFKFN